MSSYLPIELQCFHRYYKTNANTSQLNGIPTWNKQQESPNKLLLPFFCSLFHFFFYYFICFLHPFQINPFIISTRLDVCMCVRLLITVRIPHVNKVSHSHFPSSLFSGWGNYILQSGANGQCLNKEKKKKEKNIISNTNF